MNQSRPDQLDPSPLCWRKSSHSSGGGNECVEVANAGGSVIAVRDSKDPGGPRLTFQRREMRGLAARIHKGLLDL